MLVPYIRSSSLNQFKACEMKYTLEYLFGLKSLSGKKATLGTIFHRCFELRALGGRARRNGLKKFVDADFGELETDFALNIDENLKYCFDHYKKIETHINFDNKDFQTIYNWIHNTLTKYPTYDPAHLNIINTEQYFDFEINKPWAKYNGSIRGQRVKGNLRIKGTMDKIIEHTEDTWEMLDYKGLPVDTPIPTPNGWSTMGDLKIGDTVFDQAGNQVQVTAKSKIKNKLCYKITFDDTTTAICDDEHYWTLSDGSVVQIQDLKVKDKINVPLPLQCDHIDLPIDPYLLGVWLGDGRNRSCEITSGDKFIFDEIEKRGFKIGNNLEKRKVNCESRAIYDVTHILRKLNLLNNKHIPKIYLRASFKQRLDLLRGLMDSDGSVNQYRKQCIFMNCNKQLSEDVKELLLTLGQRPLLSQTKATGFGLSVDAYPISFRPNNINPFLLPVKRNKVNKSWGSGKSWRRSVVKIEQIGKKITQCISVNSKDSTYLCTKNMIPTHNTGAHRSDFASGEEKTLEYMKNDIQLLLYLIALKTLWPDKNFILTLFYINNGGMFSVHGDQEMLDRAYTMLETYFKKISQTYKPSQLDPLHKDWRCKYCCDFSKPSQENSALSICQLYKKEIETKGLQQVIDEKLNASIFGIYGSGGGRQNVEKKKEDI